MPLKILIVDDEPLARQALRGVLEEVFPQYEVVGEAKNLPEAVKSIQKFKPDVVLLDIEMPGYSGLEIIDFFEEGKLPFALIFVTAYSEHALRAFDCSAIDYLLKPVEPKSLQRALSRVQQKSPNPSQYQSLKENLQSDSPCSMSLATSDGFDIVALCDVLYLKADGAYTEVHTREQGCITVSKKLGDFEKLLPETQFMRIHRSHMINLQEIQRFSRQDGGQLTLKNGINLSVSSDRKTALQQYLSKRLI